MLRVLPCLLLASCTGWVPFIWADYGDRTGFTESQWANTEADVGDLEEWSVGVGFAYGGFLPGLVEPRPAPLVLTPPEPEPVQEEEEPTAKWWANWFSNLGPWAIVGLCILAFILKDRLPWLGGKGKARTSSGKP
jgi:hypothetical protein